MDIDWADVMRTFVTEAYELLGEMEAGVLKLEAHPDDEENLRSIFRGAHTIKGNAASLGLEGAKEVAHRVEDVLERVLAGTVLITPGVITNLLEAVDALRARVSDAAAGGVEAGVGAQRMPALPGGEAEGGGAARSRTVRVAREKLDQLLDLTGEIAVARARLGQILATLGPAGSEALEVYRDADQLYMDLQELVMRARMVPVGPMFRQFHRAVRDLALRLDKVVQLRIDGEEVEVDTAVIEHLRDPLMHMIRNAVDHGIESVRGRGAAGKEPCGSITLRARHEAGSIVIQVVDDGAGLSRERIAARARELGLAAEPDALSDADLFALIFEPGFSTARSVTDLSGRGFGMDVVRRNIESLRGTVRVESRPGEGTTVTIRLPLTLAIIDGFAVGVAGETYIVPLGAVVECIELPGIEHRRGVDRGIINLRGKVLPYVRLRDLFGISGEAPRRESVVIVKHREVAVGIAVDALYGEQQTVIKALGRPIQKIPGIAGSTILGNGRVALILDVATLLDTLERSPTRHGGNGAVA